jgi:hypothetical protein
LDHSTWSINLTTGERQSVDASMYSTPLFIEAGVVVAEVVFWSARFQSWIVLVRDRTGRTWAPEQQVTEVAAAELDHYADVLR